MRLISQFAPTIALGFIMVVPLGATVAAEDTAAGRLAAYVTNRYLTEFEEQRRGVARVELLRACGAQDLATSYMDRVVAADLDLRRGLIAAAEALDAPNLPPVDQRRSIVTSLLDAFTATDGTNRVIMLDELTEDMTPDAVICDRVRAEVLELLEAPQPTVYNP